MSTLFEIDHDYLTKLAARWLEKEKNCYVVITELRFSLAYEIPDAIGFSVSGFSTLVECKRSRSDFRRDKKKGSVHLRMGRLKYYLVPRGMITPEEVPRPWGLLYAADGTVVEVKRPVVGHEAGQNDMQLASSQRRELELLIAALRRPLHPGVFVRKLPTASPAAPHLLPSVKNRLR